MLLFVAICLHIALCLSVSSTGVAENDDDDRWRRVGNEQRTNRAIGAGSGRRAVWFVVTVVTPHSSYNTHIELHEHRTCFLVLKCSNSAQTPKNGREENESLVR